MVMNLSNTIAGHNSALGGEFSRYLAAGGIAYVADFGLLYVLTEFGGLFYLTSAAISFNLGLVITYVLSVTWVFRERVVQDRRVEFIVFALIGMVGLGLNELFIWLFASRFVFHYLIAKVFTTTFVLLWNFSARKYMLFR